MFAAIVCGVAAYQSYTNGDIASGVIDTIFTISDILIAAYWFTV
jgi:hypothetical protein